jgi:two-component system, cell cycle sensor histidine kinase and response regulator CckA
VRILVVDDDEMVRSVCCGMLRLLQHEVLTAASGSEAIEQVVAQESRFDLILLDDAMPQMSGRETLAQLFALGSRIPVIICTGRVVTPEEFAESVQNRPIAVLSKPFNLRGLQSALALVFPD